MDGGILGLLPIVISLAIYLLTYRRVAKWLMEHSWGVPIAFPMMLIYAGVLAGSFVLLLLLPVECGVVCSNLAPFLIGGFVIGVFIHGFYLEVRGA